MKVLVTGSAGFIGYHTSKRLLDSGHDVVGLDNLNDYYDITLKKDRTKLLQSYDRFSFHKINLEKIEIASNILVFLYNIFKTFKYNKTNYLLISITPYTFVAYLLLFIFRKKIFVYLRSNGYEEYKAIFGFIGPIIYHIMYICVTFKSNIITCQNKLVEKKNFHLVFP